MGRYKDNGREKAIKCVLLDIQKSLQTPGLSNRYQNKSSQIARIEQVIDDNDLMIKAPGKELHRPTGEQLRNIVRYTFGSFEVFTSLTYLTDDQRKKWLKRPKTQLQSPGPRDFLTPSRPSRRTALPIGSYAEVDIDDENLLPTQNEEPAPRPALKLRIPPSSVAKATAFAEDRAEGKQMGGTTAREPGMTSTSGEPSRTRTTLGEHTKISRGKTTLQTEYVSGTQDALERFPKSVGGAEVHESSSLDPSDLALTPNGKRGAEEAFDNADRSWRNKRLKHQAASTEPQVADVVEELKESVTSTENDEWSRLPSPMSTDSSALTPERKRNADKAFGKEDQAIANKRTNIEGSRAPDEVRDAVDKCGIAFELDQLDSAQPGTSVAHENNADVRDSTPEPGSAQLPAALPDNIAASDATQNPGGYVKVCSDTGIGTSLEPVTSAVDESTVGSQSKQAGVNMPALRQRSPCQETTTTGHEEANRGSRADVEEHPDNEVNKSRGHGGSTPVPREHLADGPTSPAAQTTASFVYPEDLRFAENIGMQLERLLNRVRDIAWTIAEQTGLDGTSASLLTAPCSGLGELYSRIFSDHGRPWKASATRLLSEGCRTKHLFAACIGATLFDKVFTKPVPWQTAQDLSRMLQDALPIADGLMKALGAGRSFEFLLYQMSADRLKDDGVFHEKYIQPVAEELSLDLFMTLIPQLMHMNSEVKMSEDLQKEISQHLTTIFATALLLRGRLEAAPVNYRYFWTTTGEAFDDIQMEEVTKNKAESVGVCMLPGILEEVHDLKTGLFEWRVKAKAQVFGI